MLKKCAFLSLLMAPNWAYASTPPDYQDILFCTVGSSKFSYNIDSETCDVLECKVAPVAPFSHWVKVGEVDLFACSVLNDEILSPPERTTSKSGVEF